MYRQLFLVLLISAVVFVHPVAGEIVWQNNCTGSTLQRNATFVVDGSSIPLSQPPITCANGCAANGLECNSPENIDSGFHLAIGVTLALIALIFAYLSVSAGKEHWPLQMLFLGASIMFMIIDVTILMASFTYTQANIINIMVSNYALIIWVFFFVVAYLLITILWYILKALKSPESTWREA